MKENYIKQTEQSIMDFKEIVIEDDVERMLILRKRLNMSQFQFAKVLNVSQSYIGQVERYEYPLNDPLRKRIEKFLKREHEWNEQNLHRSL